MSRRPRISRLVLFCGLWLSTAATFGASFPPVRGSGGAVASSEVASTEVGLETLRQGGNAVDAAVATALALVVVHPEAGNLGGGGFAIVKMGEDLATLDFRETAPARATADMYLDQEGRPRSQASRVGPLAAGVPGSPVGLWELHRRFGSLPWPDVVAPAQKLAADGFRVTTRLHRSLTEEQANLAEFPESASVWLPGGQPPAVGTLFRQPTLAVTLMRYAETGPTALTTGFAADAVARISAKYGGILQAADLAAYRAVWRPALRFEAFGWAFAAMDQPSSGGIILGQTLKLLESLGWQEYPRFGAQRAHLLAEVWKRSFADRYLMGDPSTTEADTAELLSRDWLDWRRSTLTPNRATPSAEVVSTPAKSPREGDDTTHISVIDGAGNLVALTTTLNDVYGCKVLVPELGYFLNNEMDDFTAAPGHPNLYGLIQGEANAIAPGKRMLSSMSPTIAWAGDRTLALGGRGGSRIPTAVLQVVLAVVVDNDPLQTAIDRPRIHHQWLPDVLYFESDALSPETWMALENWGHAVEPWEKDATINAVMGLANRVTLAAGDPRGPSAAGATDPIP
jgi:gamma-glutamyltranspeptidase/glutathione hydrolase